MFRLEKGTLGFQMSQVIPGGESSCVGCSAQMHFAGDLWGTPGLCLPHPPSLLPDSSGRPRLQGCRRLWPHRPSASHRPSAQSPPAGLQAATQVEAPTCCCIASCQAASRARGGVEPERGSLAAAGAAPGHCQEVCTLATVQPCPEVCPSEPKGPTIPGGERAQAQALMPGPGS